MANTKRRAQRELRNYVNNYTQNKWGEGNLGQRHKDKPLPKLVPIDINNGIQNNGEGHHEDNLLDENGFGSEQIQMDNHPPQDSWVSRCEKSSTSSIEAILRHKKLQHELERSERLQIPLEMLAKEEDEQEDTTPAVFRLIKRMIKNMITLDGIDEVAGLASLILPGVAGPAAATAILGIAAPLVWLGVIGMTREYKSACQQLQELLEQKLDTKEKLTLLAGFSDQWRGAINKRLGLNIKPQNKPSLGKNASLDEVAIAMSEYEQLQSKELVLALSKRYGWTGVVGMAAMFTGILTGVGKNFMDIMLKMPNMSFASAADVSNFFLALNILQYATGGFFLGGQAAMCIYAGNRVRQGAIKIKMHRKEIAHVESASDALEPETIHHLTSLLEKDIYYVKSHHVKYGVSTIVGQVFMGAGTALSMTGVASWVGLIFVGIGAPITLFSAIYRIVMEKKHENFHGGDDVENIANAFSELFDPIKLIGTDVNNENRYKEALDKLEKPFHEVVNQLVMVKILSILHHAMNDRLYRRKSPQEKYDKIMRLFKNANLKRSGLESPIATEVIEAFSAKNEDNIKAFLGLDRHEANERLKDCTIECLSNKRVTQDAIFDKLSSSPNEKIEHKDHKAYFDELGIKIDWEKNSRDLSREIIDQSKTLLKASRTLLKNMIVNVISIKKVAEELAVDCKDKSFGTLEEEQLPPVLPNAPPQNQGGNIANDNIPNGFGMPSSIDIEGFKQRIEQVGARKANGEHIHPQEFVQQQQEVNSLRQQQNLRDFTLKEKYTHLDKTIYIWNDPRKGYCNDPNCDIIYTVDNISGKIDVSYGNQAKALILVSPHIETRKGARMFEITKGNCWSYGDHSNDQYNYPQLSRHYRGMERGSNIALRG